MADGSGVVDPKKRVKQMIDAGEQCFADRQPWMTRWQEIADFVIPGIGDFTNQRSPAAKRMTKVYDPTQIVSNEMLAAALHGEVTNPVSKWIDGVDIVDDASGLVRDEPDMLVQGEDARDKLLKEFYRPGANFATHAHEVYLTLPAIATACMFTGWNRDRDCLLFQTRHMAEVATKEGIDGMVETTYAKWQWSIEQAAVKFGPKALSEKSRAKLDDRDPKKAQDKITILHLVTPRRERNYASMRPDQRAIANTYIEIEAQHVLEETGFHETPYAVSRWGKIPGEDYGNRSPGWNLLGDIKQLQLVDRDMTTYFQKMTDPNLLAPNDGFIGPYRSGPGKVSYYDSTMELTAYKWWEAGGDPNAALKFTDGRRDRIRQGFYLDLFDFAPQGQPITATEADIRNSRRLRLLGPLYGRLQAEFLMPVVMRAIGLLLRAYRLPALPKGCSYQPRFISPEQLALKAQDLQPLYRALELDQAIETAHPGAADVMDWDAAKRMGYDRAGVPAKLMLPKAIVEANQRQAQALSQATQTAQAANLGAQASLSVAKTRQTVAETEAGVM